MVFLYDKFLRPVILSFCMRQIIRGIRLFLHLILPHIFHFLRLSGSPRVTPVLVDFLRAVRHPSAFNSRLILSGLLFFFYIVPGRSFCTTSASASQTLNTPVIQLIPEQPSAENDSSLHSRSCPHFTRCDIFRLSSCAMDAISVSRISPSFSLVSMLDPE